MLCSRVKREVGSRKVENIGKSGVRRLGWDIVLPLRCGVKVRPPVKTRVGRSGTFLVLYEIQRSDLQPQKGVASRLVISRDVLDIMYIAANSGSPT